MSIKSKAYIAGVFEHPTRKADTQSLAQLHAESARGALEDAGLLKRETLLDVDVGFAFLPAYWRKGFAFESGSAVLAHGREAFGLKRIVAITSPDNVASIGVLEKMGLKFEALIRLGDDAREVKLFGVNFQSIGGADDSSYCVGSTSPI